MAESSFQNLGRNPESRRFLGRLNPMAKQEPDGADFIAEGNGFRANPMLHLILVSYGMRWESKQFEKSNHLLTRCSRAAILFLQGPHLPSECTWCKSVHDQFRRQERDIDSAEIAGNSWVLKAIPCQLHENVDGVSNRKERDQVMAPKQLPYARQLSSSQNETVERVWNRARLKS